MEPTAKTDPSKTIVPKRMARLLVQGRGRAGGVVKPDQFTSALRIGSACAKEMGTIRRLTSAASRLCAAWLVLSFMAPALTSTIGAIMALLVFARSAGAANGFELKISGYFNLTPGSVLHGAGGQIGSSVGVVPEGEIELTPQYHLEGDTILAARIAINTNADVGQSFQSGDLLIPEVSAFAIGTYGRSSLSGRTDDSKSANALRFRRVSSGSLPLRSPSRLPSSAPSREPGSTPTGDYRQPSCKVASRAESTLSLTWAIRSASTMLGRRSSFTSLRGFVVSMRQPHIVRELCVPRVSRSRTRQRHLAPQPTRSTTLQI